jgi:catechol 2,3-dioxygenase-like lactoylglutathione lyase family enzyme
MFSHIMLGTNDLERAKAFYDKLLGTLGAPSGWIDGQRVFWRTPTGVFAVSSPINGEPATVGNGSTVGFSCQSIEQVNAWHEAGIAHGGTPCEDAPGIRQGSVGQLYLAYLRDPDGHKLCGMYRLPKA